jgi:hypothetical protein
MMMLDAGRTLAPATCEDKKMHVIAATTSALAADANTIVTMQQKRKEGASFDHSFLSSTTCSQTTKARPTSQVPNDKSLVVTTRWKNSRRQSRRIEVLIESIPE